MAFAAKEFFQGALSATLTTTLYTNPGAVTSIIKNIAICNTGASSRAVTLATNGSGAAHRICSGMSVAAGETVLIEGHFIITSGLTFTGGQDSGTDVTVTADGVEG